MKTENRQDMLDTVIFVGGSLLVFGFLMLVLTLCGCAATQTQVKAAPEQLIPMSDDVKDGLRPLPCVQPAHFHNGLPILEASCKYNINPQMPAVCGYLGKSLEEDDNVMICGQVWVQNTCTSKFRLTMKQCVLPIEKSGRTTK